MAFLKEFGSYLPAKVVSNDEIGAQVGCDAEWIRNVSGIEERRFAAEGETVCDMAVHAARDCMDRAGMALNEIKMLLVSSGSSERQFPGPAASVAKALGLHSIPAVDLPMASAGSLFGLSLAARLSESVGNILVIGSEKMSQIIERQPMERAVAILFGDGAGACLVTPNDGKAEVVDSALYSDGSFSEDLRVEFGAPLEMNGRSVILQATRKIPRAISDLLEKHNCGVSEIGTFLMHQANQNLIARIARALGVAEDRFYSNISRYGNTSSASMLIAAAEWSKAVGFEAGVPVCFAAFGAGFHWGALLVVGRA